MDTFSIIRNAVAASAKDETREGLDLRTIETGRIVAAVQVVVDALTPADGGGRYIVGFADISTAATSLGERRIVVSSKPLSDPTLSMVEKAVVIATFAAHEIGHTFVTAPRKALVSEHNPKSGYHAVANLADDIILEPYMVEQNPILEDAFEFTGSWVLRTTAPTLPLTHRMRRDMTTAERFNVILSATRYGDTSDIVFTDAVTLAERDWARDWKRRLIEARISDHATFLALCDEMWDRVRQVADEDEVEQPPIIDGPDGPTNETDDEPVEDEDEDEPPVTDGGEEPTDEQPDDDEPPVDGPTNPTDKPGEIKDPNDEPVDFDEPTDDEDGDDEPEPPTGKGKGDGDDDDEDADDDETDGPTKPTDGEDGEPTGDPEPRDEDDIDLNEIDKSTHDQAERPQWSDADDNADLATRTFNSATSVTFGRHGRLITLWD